MKSTAKSINLVRELKDKLEFRGLSVVESLNSEGYGRLVIDTDQASVEIISANSPSPDVFGNALVAFAPHYIKLSIDAAIDMVVYSKLVLELGKIGCKIEFHTGIDLATAEAAAASAEFEYDILFPTKGN